MSLYLISKDIKLREALGRQMEKGCIWVNSLDRLRALQFQIKGDCCPVLLIDDTLSERGHLSVLEAILCSEIRGMKILLSTRLHTPFVSDPHISILKKPLSLTHLIELLVKNGKSEALKTHLSEEHLKKVSLCHNIENSTSTLIGSSKSIKQIRKIIERVGPSFSTVHINGETGAGKEVVATLLQKASLSPSPFVILNCSSIPTTLADTVLFGNVKGAYTDAKEAHDGIVRLAHNGILFLDELEDLHQEVQGKLLRLLETGHYRPVGSSKLHHSKFRLITASNIPLKELTQKKILRNDLYNRLNQLIITIPPLRQRREDIPDLVNYYLAKIGETRSIESETMNRIISYNWPGNVRELFKEIDLLSLFASSQSKTLSYREILTESVLLKTPFGVDEKRILQVSETP